MYLLLAITGLNFIPLVSNDWAIETAAEGDDKPTDCSCDGVKNEIWLGLEAMLFANPVGLDVFNELVNDETNDEYCCLHWIAPLGGNKVKIFKTKLLML